MTIEPGGRSADVPALAHYLSALGDSPSGAADRLDARLYDGAIVDAVKRFQARHGLQADGVLGRLTRKALAVPLSSRVRQIELSLERLRWLPEFGGQRLLAVNIPMFQVWGMEGDMATRTASFSSVVIAGRALATRTPVLVEQMEDAIFRPYSGTCRLHSPARDPARDQARSIYLRRHDMEMVPVPGGFRVRQRPGPGNSLGS